MKQITLKEFWNNDRKLVIHCKTEEEANKLLEAFDKLGKKWGTRDSYLEYNCWNKYREDTCYDNANKYSRFDFYKEENYIIYEFEDVDLGAQNNEKARLNKFI